MGEPESQGLGWNVIALLGTIAWVEFGMWLMYKIAVG